MVLIEKKFFWQYEVLFKSIQGYYIHLLKEDQLLIRPLILGLLQTPLSDEDFQIFEEQIPFGDFFKYELFQEFFIIIIQSYVFVEFNI